MAADGERNIHQLCLKLLVNGRQKGDVKREKEREERNLARPPLNSILDPYGTCLNSLETS